MGSFLEVWRLRRVIFRHGEIDVARNWKVKRLHFGNVRKLRGFTGAQVLNFVHDGTC